MLFFFNFETPKGDFKSVQSPHVVTNNDGLGLSVL